jgi:hypothetical protein
MSHLSNQASMVVVVLALLSAASAKTPDKLPPFDTHSLMEVRTLKGLPDEVNALLGRATRGSVGIADLGEAFNRTEAADWHLPMRRFIIAGSSLNSVLVAYELGGHAYSIRAKGFVLGRTGWQQVGAWTLNTSPHSLRELVELVSPQVQNWGTVPGRPWREVMLLQQRIHASRPSRRDGPLRADNLTDEEVREIQAVVAGVHPGSIVNISGVVSGCPCEDGPACADQVWIVAFRANQNKGLQLAKVNGRWEIGPLQQWWLDLEKLTANRERYVSAAAYDTALNGLYGRFPACNAPTGNSTVTPAVGPSASRNR